MEKDPIRVLGRGDEQALEEFLYPRLESSMFLYGNMQQAGLHYRGRRLEGTYVAAFDDQQITGVVTHYWNGNLVLQAPMHLESLLWIAKKVSARPVAGILGPDEQVLQAKEIYGIRDTNLRHDEAEGLYGLAIDDLIVPSILKSGTVRGRRAKRDDAEFLTEWLMAMNVETLNMDDDPKLHRLRRETTERVIDAGQAWILELGDRPVATSGFNAFVQGQDGVGVVQIGGVYTPPAYRSRGYARSIVAASLLAVKEESIGKAILFTAQSNIPAQKAYAAIGFQRLTTYRLTFLKNPI